MFEYRGGEYPNERQKALYGIGLILPPAALVVAISTISTPYLATAALTPGVLETIGITGLAAADPNMPDGADPRTTVGSAIGNMVKAFFGFD